jgi:hypothetical protein
MSQQHDTTPISVAAFIGRSSCPPPSLPCQILQLAPLPLVALLRPSCLVGCLVARWPLSASQLAPPALIVPSICWLLRGIFCDACRLGFPPPLITPPPPLVIPLWFFGWLLCHVAWHPGLPPPRVVPLRPSCMFGCFVAMTGALATFPPPLVARLLGITTTCCANVPLLFLG